MLNLLFVGLYRLDPSAIGGTAGSRASVAEVFVFSVQTLGSIGYGVLRPVGAGLRTLAHEAEPDALSSA